MPYHNPRLRNALAEYTVRAATVLNDLNAYRRILSIPRAVWERHGEDAFHLVQRSQLIWAVPISDHEDHLRNLAEYKACSDILTSDPVTKTQVNTLVGTRTGGVRLSLDNVINAPLLAIAHELQMFGFDMQLFEGEYAKVERALFEDFVEFERLAPLRGFFSERDHISLTPEISISRLADDEIIHLLNSGFALGDRVAGTDFVMNVGKFCIRTRYKLPKITGDANFEKLVPEETPYINGEVELQVLRALRAYKAGGVYPVGVLTQPLNLITEFSQLHPGSTSTPFFLRERYSLSFEETKEFAGFWRAFSHRTVVQRQALETAIRRLSYAGDRTNDEDKVIDLLICAEALLLSEQDDWHGEITYRLSHRAAGFLGNDPQHRRAIFDFFREAYGVRSKIVHGTKNPRLPIRDGATRYTFPEFITALEAHVRTAVKKAIGLAVGKEPREPLVDWKLLMFPTK